MKNMRFYFILIIIFLIFPVFTVKASANNNLISTFKQIRKNTSWPIIGADFDDIISAFGPRYYSCQQHYDWHRGLDIEANEGAQVVAVAKGKLYDVADYSGGGKTVIIRHKFSKGTKFKGKDLDYYYTYYMHLSKVGKKLEQAAENNELISIKKSQKIGKVGHTGNATTDHLHLEVRVGTPWSLETQLAYPSSYYNFGFDPAINAMMLYTPLANDMSLSILQSPNKTKRAEIRFTTSDDQPMLNRVSFKINNKKTKKVIKSHTLNYNKRKGFDATTNDALDTPDKTQPNISPLADSFNSEHYSADIIIPKKYIKKYLKKKYKMTLTVYDIWSRNKKTIIQN